MALINEALTAQIETELGGVLQNIRRLSGGASRVTFSFDLVSPLGERQSLILQQYRGPGAMSSQPVHTESDLLTLARANGVLVPRVVAAFDSSDSHFGSVIVERLTGESIPRRILRDDEFAKARKNLTAQCARSLAAIHRIDSSRVRRLAHKDPFENPTVILDTLGEPRPSLELGIRWLARHREAPHESTLVHGDFRMGNFLVDENGLTGVLDWELAHRGDPAEDIGWLCARAWRFGGSHRVGGFGELQDFLDAYKEAGGIEVSVDSVRWWEVYATIKWATICALQASAHLSGSVRSIELAAIGRRICENEWDLFRALDIEIPPQSVSADDERVEDELFGRPSAAELLEAASEYLQDKVMADSEGAERYEATVARNVIRIVERQQRLGPQLNAAHRQRLSKLGYASNAALAASIRSGELDDDIETIAVELCGDARDQLLVSNPKYMSDQ